MIHLTPDYERDYSHCDDCHNYCLNDYMYGSLCMRCFGANADCDAHEKFIKENEELRDGLVRRYVRRYVKKQKKRINTTTIQLWWGQQIYYNPYHPVGIKKINRDYDELINM